MGSAHPTPKLTLWGIAHCDHSQSDGERIVGNAHPTDSAVVPASLRLPVTDRIEFFVDIGTGEEGDHIHPESSTQFGFVRLTGALGHD